MNLFIQIITILFLLYNWHRAKEKAQDIICRAPNDFFEIIAPPGTGKSCLASNYVRKALKNKRKVYSTTPIRGAIEFDIKDLGKRLICNCDLILDEAGTILNNRNWHNNLTNEGVEFIKKHRHYDINVYCFSQAPGDFDNKFRDLVNRTYLLNKSKIPFVVFAQSIKRVMKLEGGQIADYLEEDKKHNFRFYLPPTWAYFDSWERNKNLKIEKEKIYSIIDLK